MPLPRARPRRLSCRRTRCSRSSYVALPGRGRADLRRFSGVRFDGEAALRVAVDRCRRRAAPRSWRRDLRRAARRARIVADCGKAALLPAVARPRARARARRIVRAARSRPGEPGSRGRRSATGVARGRRPRARAHALPRRPRRARPTCVAAPRRLPRAGRRRTVGPQRGPRSRRTPTIAGGGAIAAGAIVRDGVHARSTTRSSYTRHPRLDAVRSSGWSCRRPTAQRPYVRLGGDWVLDSGADATSVAVLDGLWFGAHQPLALVLRGDFERVTLRHDDARPRRHRRLGGALAPVRSSSRAASRRSSSTTRSAAPIRVAAGGVLIEPVVMRDSSSTPAAVRRSTRRARSSTSHARPCIGRVDCRAACTRRRRSSPVASTSPTRRAAASASAPRRRAAGCRARTSRTCSTRRPACSRRCASATPATRSSPATPGRARARRARTASEIGAWSSLRDPIRLDGLRAKVEEYLPFGLVPFFVFET